MALIALASLSQASLAHAGWLPPVDISEAGQHAGVPKVVLDAAGNATAVWERWTGNDTTVEQAYRPAGGAWQAPEDISEPSEEPSVPGEDDAYSPDVVVDGAGDTTIVWARSAGTNRILIQSVYRPVGGSWQPAVDLGEMHSMVDPEPRVATDEAGDTTAVWKSGEVVESAYRPAGAAWEPAVALSAGESYVPEAAMDAGGDTLVAWMHYDGSHYVVEGSYRPAGGDWEARRLISEAGEEGGDPVIAIGGSGEALVVWTGNNSDGEAVRAAFRPSGEGWQEPVDVSQIGKQSQALQVALDRQGDAMLVWTQSDGGVGSYDLAQASYMPVGGDWSTPTVLSEEGHNAYPSDVVFDKLGNAAVVWVSQNGAHYLVQSDYRPATHDWQQPTTLSEEGKDSMDPSVVLDSAGGSAAADGDATVVWTASEGGCDEETEDCKTPATYHVQAAGYDAIEPSETLEVPTVGEAGQPVEVSAPSLDVFSPRLSFGDGSEAAATKATHTYDAPGEYTVTFSDREVLGYPHSVARKIVVEPAANGSPAPSPPASKDGGVSPGVTPSPGVAPSAVVSPAPGPAAFTASVVAVRRTLRTDYATKELRFLCRLSEAGRCYVNTRLGDGRVTLDKAGRALVIVRLRPKAMRALRGLRVLRLPFSATAVGRTHVSVEGQLSAR